MPLKPKEHQRFLNRAIIKEKQEGKIKENGWSEIAAFSKTLACFYPESPDAICTASGDTLLCQETDKDPPKISGARGRQRSHLGRCFIETSKMAGLALEDGTRTLKTSTLGFVDQTQHRQINRHQAYRTLSIESEYNFVIGPKKF
ncbi:hypothetical protein CHARACLAT_001923 [Characodon lateralis]|uniref:Uncharacterized protein n=1 Tax=Characodon lateralis TaxID=208331 RepID=A0ABU7DD80_9TELE|nr:hypothetical protein [Characodon lateralis]